MSTQSSLTSSGLPSPPRTPPKSPQNPYFKGAKFTAKRHEPPTASEMGYGEDYRAVPEVDQGSSQLEWCLAHPPAPGITHEADQQCIELAGVIRIGENCGAQVVLTADGLIAKIYDPLYYKFHDDGGWAEYINVTDSADCDYITEVTAYSELIVEPLQGSIAPRYYGSWTLSIPLYGDGEKQVREVRLILLEYVSGKTMIDVNPLSLNQDERENIMIKLIEADMALRFSGVNHEDLEPRNVMLSMQDTSTNYAYKNLRVCIIDFACCWFPNDEGGRAPHYLMHNPLHYWAAQAWYSDWGWLPPRKEAVEWMWKTWGNGGEDGKYVVVERDAKSRLGKPKSPFL